MMPLLKELKPKNNSAASFYPASANSANNKYDWETVVGLFIKSLHKIELEKSIETLDDFKLVCKTHFKHKFEGKDIWPVIEKMYFANEDVVNISPEMQVLKTLNPERSQAGDERLTALFINLAADLENIEAPSAHLNFLEQEIKNTFDTPSVTTKKSRKAKPYQVYLPFLAELFQQDLKFLVQHPDHFLSNIKAFLKLYGFIYTAQLSLNIKGWKSVPEVKPCFFILDNEKASKERTQLQLHGHKQVVDASNALFPYLALTESLQDPKELVQPLWQLVPSLNQHDTDNLNKYIYDFHEDRKLTSQIAPAESPEQAIEILLQLFTEQFKKGSTRETAFNNFVKATRETLIKPFEVARGRAGAFFVLNQDYLLLLTNLAIGERDQLRLHELIVEFKKRGVFFDKNSEECLIDLFERMGNVERMSDSGDAVYVKKTI